MERYRFYEIDLLRFLAAFAVMLYHYTLRGWAADDMSVLQFPELGVIFQYGRLGVDLFFIISGFVILMTAMNKNHIEFVISRVARLYPAFWFCVTLTAVVILLIGGERYDVGFVQYLANLTMLHKFVGIPSIDGVYWSLVVELKFYFMVFLLIVFKQVHNMKYFLGLWLVIAVVLNFTGVVPILTAVFIPDWAAYFIAGATFYLIRKEGISLYYVVLIFVSYLLALDNAIEKVEPFYLKYSVQPSVEVIVGLITLFYGFFLALSMNVTKFMNKPWFVYLGVMTYPLYLIHQNIGFMVFNVFHDSVNKYVLLGAVVLVMLVASYLISKYIESRGARALRGALVAGLGKIGLEVKR